MYEFRVINLTATPLPAHSVVRWNKWFPVNGDIDTEEIDVSGLAPFTLSATREIRPAPASSITLDYWGYWINNVVKTKEYELKIKTGDRYILVAISDYGFSVIVTHTAPDTWQW